MAIFICWHILNTIRNGGSLACILRMTWNRWCFLMKFCNIAWLWEQIMEKFQLCRNRNKKKRTKQIFRCHDKCMATGWGSPHSCSTIHVCWVLWVIWFIGGLIIPPNITFSLTLFVFLALTRPYCHFSHVCILFVHIWLWKNFQFMVVSSFFD